MSCREAIAILADYLDATLSPSDVGRLEDHLAQCDECQAYLVTYRATRRLAAEAIRVEMPQAMRERLRSFLVDRLQRSR